MIYGQSCRVAGRRLAAVPRHYNRSSTSGSEESAQAHITLLLLLTPSPPVPVQLNNALPPTSLLLLLHH